MAADLKLPFTPEEYLRRLQGLQAGLRKLEIDAALIMDPANLVYFTGLGLHGQLIVPADGRDPVYLVQINVEQARYSGWISDTRPSVGLRTVKGVLSELGLSGAAFSLGLELDALPYTQVGRISETLVPGRVANVSPVAAGLRLVKSESELAMMDEAARISAANFARFRELLRPGVTEATLFAALQANEMELGADRGARARAWNTHLPHGLVTSGPGTATVSGYWLTMTGAGQSAAEPYGTGRRPLKLGDLVVLDRAAVCQGYMVDEARTFVAGQADPRQQDYWEALEVILDAAIAAVRPGRPVAEVYAEALRAAKEMKLDGCFMTRSMTDFEYVGHGVGLEIDEPPLVSPKAGQIMVPGMTLALEPKVIIPGWGGLTMEETVAVTPEGRRILTRSPRHPLSVNNR